MTTRQIPDLANRIIRPNNEQTVFMYLPWSTNLTDNFKQNIIDLEKVVATNVLKNERIIVFMCTKATEAALFELVYEDGKAVRKTYKYYDYPSPTYTTAEGIASILDDVQDYTPCQTICNDYRVSWFGMDTCIEMSKPAAVSVSERDIGNTRMCL